MSPSTIRQKLHSYLEVANDKKLAEIYSLLETDVNQSGIIYSDEYKRDLDRRYAAYQSGVGAVSEADSKNRVQQLLQARDRYKEISVHNSLHDRSGKVIDYCSLLFPSKKEPIKEVQTINAWLLPPNAQS